MAKSYEVLVKTTFWVPEQLKATNKKLAGAKGVKQFKERFARNLADGEVAYEKFEAEAERIIELTNVGRKDHKAKSYEHLLSPDKTLLATLLFVRLGKNCSAVERASFVPLGSAITCSAISSRVRGTWFSPCPLCCVREEPEGRATVGVTSSEIILVSRPSLVYKGRVIGVVG